MDLWTHNLTTLLFKTQGDTHYIAPFLAFNLVVLVKFELEL